MADPFEVRMRFTSQLQHLNASGTSSQKAAHYALKYRDMDEDLHSCILEQLEKNSMNNRANILYFIEHLCDVAQKENHLNFVRMVQRDIFKVVDHVAPDDGSGAANVKVIRRVLNGLQSKKILVPATVTEIEACLKDRETQLEQSVLDPIEAVDNNNTQQDVQVAPAAQRVNGFLSRPDKRQIEQRIEEDRERHKRFRESIWAVGGDEDEEFEKMWVQGSVLREDDFLAAEEDAMERRLAVMVN
ncbi:hypothetical protein MMC25_004247 [Agyrium rufum]|nr:hypothetical protein [Agyrium rufum]